MVKESFELNPSDYFMKNERMYVHSVRVTPEDLKHHVSRFDGNFHRDRYITFLFVVSGSATEVVGNDTFEIKKGDLLFINYDVSHARFFNKSEKTPFIYYEIIFVPQFFGTDCSTGNSYSTLADSFLLDQSLALHEFGDPPYILTHPKSDVLSLFKKMHNEFVLRKIGFSSIIRTALIELITKFHRELSPNSQINYYQQKMVDNLILFLENNYENPDLDIDSFLENLYISKSYFKQIFKKATGKAISAYLLHIRLNNVCEMLRNFDLSITESARRCGFGDMKSFYRSFKNTVGMLPSEYRKNLKN